MPHIPGHGRGVWEPGKPSKPYTPTSGPVTISRPEPRRVTATTKPGTSGGYQPPDKLGGSFQGATTGYGEGQVDPGLVAAVITQKNIPGMTEQRANQIAQESMGSTGIGFGIGSLPSVAATTQTPIVVDEDETIFKKTVDKGKETLLDFWSKISPTMAIGKGAQALLDKWFKNPTAEQLRDQNFLAIMKQALGENTDEFVKRYKKTISEAFKGDSSEEDFLRALESAEPPQGSESQRRVAPWDYYNPDLYYDKVFPGPAGMMQSEYDLAMQDYPEFLSNMGLSPISSRFGNTMGNLEDIANIPVTAEMQGKYPDFVRQIFEAREAVSRSRQEDRQRSGGGAGIMGAVPTPFTDVNNNGILDSLEVAQATTVPAATTTAATMTTPTPFDYSQWSQFGPQYPGSNQYLGSNYVNQGLGQGPNFDYWNQIARTFPGMT